MLAWSFIIVLFWKPIYWLGKYIYSKFITKDDTHSLDMEQFKKWFSDLVALVRP